MNRKLKIPRATYRLQFHRDFTLRDALALVPYLHELGVSHLYASPLLAARKGSMHGYDVCDPTKLNPELGTKGDLEALVHALHERGMGLVLDLVPNHMAASPENPWWWDVLKLGPASAYANYFDVDWNSSDPQLRGKILLPVLGDELKSVLERGELKVVCENDEVTVRYYDHRFPASPGSLVVPEKTIEQAVASFNASRAAMTAFLERQHYLLTFWRHGNTQVNYRRFFNIIELAGLRVELPQVFADSHNRILDWYQRGWLDGLRIDHPDGLLDPEQYLQCLRQSAFEAWITVEKILEPGEDLPTHWPVAGTTGYDFLNRVTGLFIDPAGEKPVTDFYAAFTGEPTDYLAIVREKKRQALQQLLPTEIDRLLRLLQPLATNESKLQHLTEEQFREALIELVADFPVYRTYVQADERRVSEEDIHHVAEAVRQGRQYQPGLGDIFDFLQALLLLKTKGDKSAEFVMHFQQLTGPAMAKGVEDTTYYCFNRLVALNVVGGDPGQFGWSVAEFHAAGEHAQQQWPNAMLATSTHDTKRSEDVRARLSLLSEIPDEWAATVRRWSALNEKHRRDNLPDRNAEYLFYQTVLGAWPLSVERAVAYMEKAAREAKQHTTWTEINEPYEAALKHFVAAVLDDQEFVAEVKQFLKSLIEPGRINSLAQTLLKLTTPGVPDIYQGTELWDLSLVDPDNRRPVDYAVRQRRLAELKNLSPAQILARSDEGLPKLWLIQKTLKFRERNPEAFGAASKYEPLSAKGDKAAHVVAFNRSGSVITIVPRLVMRLANNWANTTLTLPDDLRDTTWLNVLTGEQISATSATGSMGLPLAEVFSGFPVALLEKVAL
jgi:(1->4)-alpha-D-glucan 1-alpha-D-glucosylmutase